MKKLNRKRIFGAAVVHLIAVAMIISSFTAVADDNTLTASWTATIEPTTTKAGSANRDPIVWDNFGIDTASVGLSSQLDSAYPFNSQVADNFLLDEETFITDVHWWGVFWNPGGGPNPAAFNIIFYADAGGKPTGAGTLDPTPTALAVYFFPAVTGTLIGPDQYEYDVVLPDPFIALPGEMYWIAIQWVGDYPPQWGWYTNGNNPELLLPSLQGFPLIGMAYWTPHTYGDMAFFLTGTTEQPPDPIPDLTCEGTLSWDQIKPGATVYGEFVVKNIGDAGSVLNWDVASNPTWGTWTFTPDGGTGLAAGDSVIVNVTVVAPAEKKKEFTGKVKIVNLDNASNFCEIDVILVTPLSSHQYIPPFMTKLFERFPNAFPLLRHLLGF